MIKTKMMWTPVTKTWMMETVIPITHHAQREAWSTLPAVSDRALQGSRCRLPAPCGPQAPATFSGGSQIIDYEIWSAKKWREKWTNKLGKIVCKTKNLCERWYVKKNVEKVCFFKNKWKLWCLRRYNKWRMLYRRKVAASLTEDFLYWACHTTTRLHSSVERCAQQFR